MNKKFVCALNKEDMEYLVLNGFKFICEQRMGNQIIYVFHNECDKLNFALDSERYILHDMLFFS